jgi:fermentation-respiration switch protein FrsA (DUF1100 family)
MSPFAPRKQRCFRGAKGDFPATTQFGSLYPNRHWLTIASGGRVQEAGYGTIRRNALSYNDWGAIGKQLNHVVAFSGRRHGGVQRKTGRRADGR